MDGWIAILVVGALLFFWGYGDLVQTSHKSAERIREMLHKERMTALEKGLPAPDGSFDEALIAYMAESGDNGLDVRATRRRAYGWAIMLILGGAGWWLATMLVGSGGPMGWLSQTFSFGIIPMVLGVGIVIHTLITTR